MNTTYAQKQAPAQRKEANTAASVIDSSSQGEALQRKADMVNGVVQRVITAGSGALWHIHPQPDHVHSHMKFGNFERNKVVFGDEHGCRDVCTMLVEKWRNDPQFVNVTRAQLKNRDELTWNDCMSAINKENKRYRGK